MIQNARCLSVILAGLLGWGLMGRLRGADGLPDPTPPIEIENTKKLPLNEILGKKVSCDFEESPVVGVMEFLGHAAKVKIEVPADVSKHPEIFPSITMKVTDMPLQNALNFVCRLGGLRWEPDGNVIKIIPGPDALAKLGKTDPGKMDLAKPDIGKDPGQVPPFDMLGSGQIHIKYPEGGEIEVSGAVLQQLPEVTQAVADLLEDPARNGILAQKLPEEVDMPEGVTVTKIKTLLATAAPHATVEYDLDTRLLMVISDDPKELRKSGAVLRALGIHRQDAPPPADADDGGAPPAKVRLRLPAPRIQGNLPVM